MKHIQKFEGFNDPTVNEINFEEIEKFLQQEHKMTFVLLENTGNVPVRLNVDILLIDNSRDLLNMLDAESVYVLMSPDQFLSLPPHIKNRVETIRTTQDIIDVPSVKNRMELVTLSDV